MLRQAQQAPPLSPARAAAVELWTWLTGAEADRRRRLAGAEGDRPAARQLSDELRLLQTVQAGLRRGQPDIIPSHPHEATWLGARQPFPPIAAADLARVLRRAQGEVASGRGGPQLAQLVDATAARLEALAGPEVLASALERESAELPARAARRKIAAGLAAAAEREPRHRPERFLGRPVVGDATRLGATLVDADLGDQAAWRAVISPHGFDEAAEFSAAGANGYELYVLVTADGAILGHSPAGGPLAARAPLVPPRGAAALAAPAGRDPRRGLARRGGRGAGAHDGVAGRAHQRRRRPSRRASPPARRRWPWRSGAPGARATERRAARWYGAPLPIRRRIPAPEVHHVLELLSQPETWLALATLSAMEIVLGIDNVVFLAILVGRLPPAQQPGARRLGLALALVTPHRAALRASPG